MNIYDAGAVEPFKAWAEQSQAGVDDSGPTRRTARRCPSRIQWHRREVVPPSRSRADRSMRLWGRRRPPQGAIRKRIAPISNANGRNTPRARPRVFRLQYPATRTSACSAGLRRLHVSGRPPLGAAHRAISPMRQQDYGNRQPQQRRMPLTAGLSSTNSHSAPPGTRSLIVVSPPSALGPERANPSRAARPMSIMVLAHHAAHSGERARRDSRAGSLRIIRLHRRGAGQQAEWSAMGRRASHRPTPAARWLAAASGADPQRRSESESAPEHHHDRAEQISSTKA